MENERNHADAATMNRLVSATGSIVRALVATLPPEQQRVFLTRLVDAADSAEATNDKALESLILTYVEIGQSEQRPISGGAT